MTKKSLILYASMTGNTEKVALRFKEVFEKIGWECDVYKIDKNIDPSNPPFDYDNYDFLCVGSPIIRSEPVKEIKDILSKGPTSPHAGRDDPAGKPMEEIQRIHAERRKNHRESPPVSHSKIVFGPDDKKGIVFVTYAGLHQGPKEALPSLIYLETEMEHLKFQCAGRFACPGKFGEAEGWFKDLSKRPSERDLLKAEIFLEEIIEDYY